MEKAAHFTHRHLDVACELDAARGASQVDEWRSLFERYGRRVTEFPGGVRVMLDADAWEFAEDLARREAACCGFLDFDMRLDSTGVRLQITSLAPGASAVIAALTAPAR